MADGLLSRLEKIDQNELNSCWTDAKREQTIQYKLKVKCTSDSIKRGRNETVQIKGAGGNSLGAIEEEELEEQRSMTMKSSDPNMRNSTQQ